MHDTCSRQTSCQTTTGCKRVTLSRHPKMGLAGRKSRSGFDATYLSKIDAIHPSVRLIYSFPKKLPLLTRPFNRSHRLLLSLTFALIREVLSRDHLRFFMPNRKGGARRSRILHGLSSIPFAHFQEILSPGHLRPGQQSGQATLSPKTFVVLEWLWSLRDEY